MSKIKRIELLLFFIRRNGPPKLFKFSASEALRSNLPISIRL